MSLDGIMNSHQNTSLITILSSAHGRLRREQRDIDKRDLQRALRYGTMERAWGQRWKVEYDGITFITDDSRRREVTAFPSPLPEMEVDTEMRQGHVKAMKLLRAKPELATSHTVFVIDDSGSMLQKRNSILYYRDCQNAAFSMTALEFIAEQLFKESATNSDLVSLVKFSAAASVEMEREPVDWLTYNKILSHRNVERFVDRQGAPIFDSMFSQSNYLPALDKAIALLEKGYHDNSAVSLFFFSDGRPSDDTNLSISQAELFRQLRSKMSGLAAKYGSLLTVVIVGLGARQDDFTALQEMAEAANTNGAKSSFQFCDKTANSISSAVSSMVSSTTETKTALQEGRRQGYTTRHDLVHEKDATVKFDWHYYFISDHLVYDKRAKRTVHSGMFPLAAVQSDPTDAAARLCNPPPFLAINRNFFGKGAERVAYRCRLSDAEAAHGFTFGAMVAKETKDVERIDEKIFHDMFLQTQDLAGFLAEQFNERLRGLPAYSERNTPRIEFLRASVLVVDDPSWPGGERGVLVEKMLDTTRFPWTKWSDNNGMVDGKKKQIPLDVDFELKQLAKEQAGKGLGGLLEIVEEDEEDSEDEDDDSNDESDDSSKAERAESREIQPSDYLHAFTHFTTRYTNGQVLVCDLQGVFNTEMTPPTFELTDPAIHYKSTKGRRMVYGRTDKGAAGMKAFFHTHKCTKICKFLRLSGKNKLWKRDWKKDIENTSRRNSVISSRTALRRFEY
jgi:Alpha-kinase family